MRKQTKLVAVLSAAALFAIGASMTSFAATAHWEQEGEDWVYLDSDGERVTETWKKSGSNWFYLDENGYMAKDRIIGVEEGNEDIYYVDANGARVANYWVSMDNADDYECTEQEDVSTVWYFFGSNGKAKRADGDEDVKIYTNIPHGANMDQKDVFAFDAEGHMVSGWQTIPNDEGVDEYYYFGDENTGWAIEGWQYLEKHEDAQNDEDDGEPVDDEAWFYFTSKGKAQHDKKMYINGEYYVFDKYGVMDDKWVNGTPGVSNSTVDAVATAAHAYYTEDIGHRREGWLYTTPYWDDDADEAWFYLEKGEAFNDGGKDNEETSITAIDLLDNKAVEGKGVAAKKIKNETYLFDERGKMLTGLLELTGDGTEKDDKVVRVGGNDLEKGIYYFSTDGGSKNGEMATGRTVVNDNGEDKEYYFKDQGVAYTQALVKGRIYGKDGVCLKAEDSSYELIESIDFNVYTNGNQGTVDDPIDPVIKKGTNIIVNKNGTVQKSGTKTIDGAKYKIENYKATFVEWVD